MFNIRTKVIVESATVELDAVQIKQLVEAVEPLRILQGRMMQLDGVNWDKMVPVQQFVLSLAELVDGQTLAPAAPKTRQKRGQAVNPTPGEPA